MTGFHQGTSWLDGSFGAKPEARDSKRGLPLSADSRPSLARNATGGFGLRRDIVGC